MNRAQKINLGGKNNPQLKNEFLVSKNNPSLQEVSNRLLISFQSGDYQSTVNLAKNIIAQFPEHAFSWKVLGAALKNLGKVEESLEAKRKAALLMPDDAEAHRNLGTTLHGLGKLEEAEIAYKKATSINSNYAEAYNELGVILNQLGRMQEAEEYYIKAINIMPNYAEALCNLGVTLKGLGRLEEAEKSYKQAILLKHDLTVAHSNLGVLLHDLRRLDEAEISYKKVISLKPNYPDAYNNLGTILQELGRLAEAENNYKKAITIKPRFPEAHNNLGTILQELGRLEEAETSYKQAIAIKPDYAEAYANLGAMQRLRGQYIDAQESIKCALSINKKNPRILQEYSTLLAQMSNFKEVRNYSDSALENISRDKKNYQISKLWDSRLYTWIYHPDLSAQEICAEYIKWGSQYSQITQQQFLSRNRDPNRKLKIGYVSPDFKGHSCRFYFEPLFSSHDKEKFELYAYSNVKLEDEHTKRFKQYFSVWRNIVGITDQSVAKMILNDEIDILVDGCGHMGDTRLKVFTYKPAPIQVTWLGAAWTTGLPQMDYAMFDPYMAPEGTPTSEKIIQLPNTWTSFRPGEKAIKHQVKPTPAIRNGFVTFGYTGRSERLNHRVFSVWAKILKRIPNARLILDFKAFGDPKTQSYYAKFLKDHDMDETRVAMRNSENIFESLCEIDILLDSFPHNGGTMLFDAAWMGVPIVTLASSRPVGRIGTSLMTNLGLPEWIAKSENEYEDIAVNCGNDILKLALLRSEIRVRMQNSPIMNEKLFAKDVENAYRKIWCTWGASNHLINNQM